MSNEPPKSSVAWRDWGENAFSSSRSEGKPVLLALTATWCHWCHVMDQTSYSDPRVINLINDGFIPVRVDVDQRPDLSSRYNQGGYPSLAVLESDGTMIEGRIYTPPDEMVRLLEQVRYSHEKGSPPITPPIDSGRDAPQVREGTTIFLVRQRLEELYDPLYGGFGSEPKQPPWEGVELLLSMYQRSGEQRLREMACRTLDGMMGGLLDYRDGGFFRYSVARDWRVPHYEKMLVTNVRLASLFLTAFQVTRKSAYKNAAVSNLNYLNTTLCDPVTGLFWASQDAEEEYYRLPWKDRDGAAKPSIDTALYNGWNALAANTLVHAFGVLGSQTYLKQAIHVLETLGSEFDGLGGIAHVFKEPPGQPRFLADHVHAFGAYLGLHQATGDVNHLRQAEMLLHSIRQLFGASDGGFYDVGRVQTPTPGIKPVLENSLLAEGLITLATITGQEEHIAAAKATLEALGGVVPGRSYLGAQGFRKMEEDEEKLFLPAASAWARAWDRIDFGAVHLVVVGDGVHRTTRKLVQAAFKARTPGWVVQVLDARTEADVVGQLGFPADGAPAAYLCVDRQCLAPFHSPAEFRRWTKPGALAHLSEPNRP